VLQRAKRFPHVVEFAERGVEPVRLGLPLIMLLRRTLAVAAPIHDEHEDGDGGQREEDR
jgi:hypothetical protein